MSKINGFVGRRDLLKLVGVGGLGIGAIATFGSIIPGTEQIAIADANPANPNPVNASEAWKRLLAGNQRFASQKRQYPHQSLEHLQLVAPTQYPFATILGCADSRVPAEIIFDQGLGDLFVVRVAGNVASDTAIGSLEYATAILGSQLIVVLGHRRCGAVTAAIKNEPLPGRIGFIIENIKPALAKVKIGTGDAVKDAVIANIQYQVEKLHQNSVILAKLVREGQLKIVGAFYDIDTGKISFIK
ncbi:carbonic anhydrase [Cylindrospermum sp. NIES-4074]|nr:carbonic anhydrase [Cylindrospermum sp. NIES-4074]